MELNDINSEFLQRFYIDENKSIKEIADATGFTVSQIHTRIKKFNMQKTSIKKVWKMTEEEKREWVDVCIKINPNSRLVDYERGGLKC